MSQVVSLFRLQTSKFAEVEASFSERYIEALSHENSFFDTVTAHVNPLHSAPFAHFVPLCGDPVPHGVDRLARLKPISPVGCLISSRKRGTKNVSYIKMDEIKAPPSLAVIAG
jgi:hypothetical protein